MQRIEEPVDGLTASIPLGLDEDFEVGPVQVRVYAEREGLRSPGGDQINDSGDEAQREEKECGKQVRLNSAPKDEFTGLLAADGPWWATKPARGVDLYGPWRKRDGPGQTVAPAADPLRDDEKADD